MATRPELLETVRKIEHYMRKAQHLTVGSDSAVSEYRLAIEQLNRFALPCLTILEDDLRAAIATHRKNSIKKILDDIQELKEMNMKIAAENVELVEEIRKKNAMGA